MKHLMKLGFVLTGIVFLIGCGGLSTSEWNLFTACSTGNTNAVLKILASGIDVNKRLSQLPSSTPLSIAVEHGQDPIVAILLDHGADPNLSDKKNNTPLYYAIIYGLDRDNSCMVTNLLAHGAKPDAPGLSSELQNLSENDPTRVAYEMKVQSLRRSRNQ